MRMSKHDDDIGDGDDDGDGGAKNRLSPSYDSSIHLKFKFRIKNHIKVVIDHVRILLIFWTIS